jgi:two-component sensor histidine kinase
LRKLYKSKDLTNINLQDYLSDLANLIFRGFHSVAGRVKLVFEAEEVCKEEITDEYREKDPDC